MTICIICGQGPKPDNLRHHLILVWGHDLNTGAETATQTVHAGSCWLWVERITHMFSPQTSLLSGNTDDGPPMPLLDLD